MSLGKVVDGFECSKNTEYAPLSELIWAEAATEAILKVYKEPNELTQKIQETINGKLVDDFSYIDLIPGAKETLIELREEGHILAICSNTTEKD